MIFGGAVTLRAHLLHHRDYTRWILMNVVAMHHTWGPAFLDHVKRHAATFEGLPHHIHAALVGAYIDIDGAIVIPLTENDRQQLISPWLSEDGQRAFYAQFALADEVYTAEVEPLFPETRCPVAVLWGEDNPWVPVERGEGLAAALGTSFHRMPGLGHLPQLENSGLVSQALLDILPQIET